MPVPTLISQLSTTASLNSPDGAVDVPSSIDDYQRAHAAFIAQLYAGTVAAPTVIVPSATTTDIGAAASENVDISGNTTITGFGTVAEGINRKGRFTGVLTLTHNATSLILPGNANITTANNDRYEAQSLGGGNWIVTKYVYANGSVISATNATTTTPIKLQCRAATTANITLAGGAPNVADGVTLAANDRILVKDQTTGSQNGIYVVTTLGTGANGTWTRATDADGAGELLSGMLVTVSEGTVNADSMWMLTTNDPITIGTTALTFKSPSLYGTTTNDNAAAGMIGEYIESVVDEASGMSLTTTNIVNVTSISLTPGDWDVSACVQFLSSTTTNITELRGSISLVSNTVDITRGRLFEVKTAPHVPVAVRHGIAGPTLRFSLASTTTIYLIAQGVFTVSTLSVYGIISARRAR